MGGWADGRRNWVTVMRSKDHSRAVPTPDPSGIAVLYSRMQPYERFEAWQQAHALALSIFKVTSTWPASERFGITAQLRRASLSVPTNIVEGSAKRGNVEFARFLNISLGSMAEVGYLLRFARDAGFITADEWSELFSSWSRAARVLWGLYRSVKERKRIC